MLELPFGIRQQTKKYMLLLKKMKNYLKIIFCLTAFIIIIRE